MRTQATTQQDLAIGLMPNLPDVQSVRALSATELSVSFFDGVSGIVRFEPSHLSGVFAALKDQHFFKQVGVVNGAVTWPGDLDLAPDAMYEAIQKNKEWVLR